MTDPGPVPDGTVPVAPVGPWAVDRIASALRQSDWCVTGRVLPDDLYAGLLAQARELDASRMKAAGIGRETDHVLDGRVRRDRIRWIRGESSLELSWLAWAESLRLALNRRLLLGLFSFESHFARYGPGDFYRQHVDAFRNQPLTAGSQRVVSFVLYLNPDWGRDDGGELLLHEETGRDVVWQVVPRGGTAVVFLSDRVPHEVLAARRERISIAGWFRCNGSTAGSVDPPR